MSQIAKSLGGLSIPTPAQIVVRPVPAPQDALKQIATRIVEQLGGVPEATTYCPMCEYGEAGAGKSPEMCRACDQAHEIGKLKEKVAKLESRLRGMEAYHG